MNSSQELWQNYHLAVQRGDMEAAKKILKQITGYKGNPPPPSGGCAKCRKRFH